VRFGAKDARIIVPAMFHVKPNGTRETVPRAAAEIRYYRYSTTTASYYEALPPGSSPALQGQPPQQDHEHPEDGAAWDWGKADAGADDHGFPQSSQCHHSYSHYSNINVLVVFTICLGIIRRPTDSDVRDHSDDDR
jgi:hypothetical protein